MDITAGHCVYNMFVHWPIGIYSQRRLQKVVLEESFQNGLQFGMLNLQQSESPRFMSIHHSSIIILFVHLPNI